MSDADDTTPGSTSDDSTPVGASTWSRRADLAARVAISGRRAGVGVGSALGFARVAMPPTPSHLGSLARVIYGVVLAAACSIPGDGRQSVAPGTSSAAATDVAEPAQPESGRRCDGSQTADGCVEPVAAPPSRDEPCVIDGDSAVVCSDERTSRRIDTPGVVSIAVLARSLLWLDAAGAVRWVEQWATWDARRPEDMLLLLPNAAPAGTAAQLEGAVTWPPSKLEDSPLFLVCVRTARVRCWAYDVVWDPPSRSPREVTLPANPREVVVGPPLVVIRRDGTMTALDYTLTSWIEGSDAHIQHGPRTREDLRITELIRGDRGGFDVRLSNGGVVRCNVFEKLICTRPYDRR